MPSPQSAAALANDIGARYGLRCRYEYDTTRSKFRYAFYRHGCFVGSTADEKRVVKMMERFARA